MFQLVVELLLVGGAFWLLLTAIFWVKDKVSPATQVNPDPLPKCCSHEPKQSSEQTEKPAPADTK